MKKMTIEARLDNLDKVLNFVSEELELSKCPRNLWNQIATATEEIFMNVASYAYKPAKGDVAIYVFLTGEEIVIKFEDTGKPFNPLEQTDPDLDKPLMERKIGGLGIYMVKRFMDKITYARVDNKNVLTMTKEIARDVSEIGVYADGTAEYR